MSEGEAPARCPKCQGFMVQGFVMDQARNGMGVGSWAEGAPQKSFWMGTRAAGRTLPIGAFRCDRCGYLEFYAAHKFAAE